MSDVEMDVVVSTVNGLAHVHEYNPSTDKYRVSYLNDTQAVGWLYDHQVKWIAPNCNKSIGLE